MEPRAWVADMQDGSIVAGTVPQMVDLQARLSQQVLGNRWLLMSIGLLGHAASRQYETLAAAPQDCRQRLHTIARMANAIDTTSNWPNFQSMPPVLWILRGRLEGWHQEALAELEFSRIFREAANAPHFRRVRELRAEWRALLIQARQAEIDLSRIRSTLHGSRRPLGGGSSSDQEITPSAEGLVSGGSSSSSTGNLRLQPTHRAGKGGGALI